MAMYMSIRLLFCLIIRYKKVDTVSVVQGSIIQLECPLKATTDRDMTWTYSLLNSKIIYTIGTKINPNLQEELKYRLAVTGDHTAGEYHLSISEVRKSDKGTYECALSGTDALSTLQLTVIITPTSMIIENVGLDKYLNGIEGHNLMIRCSAEGGDPAPDVKLLISESVVKTAKQSVQYTLSSVIRSYDGQNVTCLAGYEEIFYYPLNDSARIFLKLKPYPPTFSSDSVQIEDTIPLVISCTSTGSRPMASIYWLLGDGRTNVTNNSTPLLPTHDPTTDTYTVTSTLTYSINKRYNGEKMICGASNEATSVHGDSIENSKMLNVKYAPDIIVNSVIYTQNDAERTVTCNPSGNPDSYHYHKWQHKSRYGDLLREFVGNKTLKLPDVQVRLRYQDSGEYVCIASNGIKDKHNQFEQTGFGYLTVNALPVCTSDNFYRVKQYGEIYKSVDIFVNVYSVPKFNSLIWTLDGRRITKNSAKYEASSSSSIVKDVFHGKELLLDGYNVTLMIRDLKADDFTNYTVTLSNAFGTVKHTIELEITGVPETPGNFSMRTTSTTSITIVWDPNSGGGHAQTFYIKYKVQGSLLWTTVSAGVEGVNEQKRRRTYELKNLQKRQTYELRMFSENIAGKRSNYTEVLFALTESSEIQTSSSTVIGGVVGAIATLGIVCASVMGIVFFKRRKGQDQTERKDKSHENTGFQEGRKENEYEEVENKCDMQQKQSSKTYESLGFKATLNFYDDLENPKGLILSKSEGKLEPLFECYIQNNGIFVIDTDFISKNIKRARYCELIFELMNSLGLYEALGNQDKPSIYSVLQNQKEQTQLRKQPTETDIRKASNNPKENRELCTNQRPIENVYDNEGF